MRRPFNKIAGHFANRIIAGVFLAVPLYLTVLVFGSLFRFADGILAPVILRFSGLHIPGMGLLLLGAILYLTGLLTLSVVVKKSIKKIESLIERIPLGGVFYRTTRQLIEVISDPNNDAFQKVVLVNYLGRGRNNIGFVTGSSLDGEGKKLIHVYIPTPPNPITGFLQFAREDQLIPTTMSFEEGAKFALSVGATSPHILT